MSDIKKEAFLESELVPAEMEIGEPCPLCGDGAAFDLERQVFYCPSCRERFSETTH